jgi:hypothetical protein
LLPSGLYNLMWGSRDPELALIRTSTRSLALAVKV